MAYNRQDSRATTTSAPAGRLDNNPSAGKFNRLKRYMKTSVADFFGVGEEDIARTQRWDNRRNRYRGAIGKLKDDARQNGDQVDGMISSANARMIHDPLRMPGGRHSETDVRTPISSTSTFAYGNLKLRRRKDSVMKMTWKGLATLAGTRKKMRAKQSLKGIRSIAPASLAGDLPDEEIDANGYTPQTPLTTEDNFSLVDDVFYDDIDLNIDNGFSKLEKIREESDRSRDSYPIAPGKPDSAPAAGWRRAPPPDLPDTPAVDMVDGIQFTALKKITNQVIDSALEKHKRTVGQGIMGKFFHRSVRSDRVTRDVKKQIDDMDDHRPYFTCWVTFVQIVIFIVSVSVYGIAPVGIGVKDYFETVTMPNLAIQRVAHRERENLWVGPRQADLIHLGAKYTPCMRFDDNLHAALELDKNEERTSACCVRNDGSGCAQMTKSRCSEILSTFEDWSAQSSPIPGRTSGSVCGQDPRYCVNPTSVPPFEWADDITEWPICEETNIPNRSLASTEDRHMSCEVVGHPCCHGIQGECIITTREHCDLIRGYYHDDKFLCSQVDCLDQICGMISFFNKGAPDQVYRLWTSLFLHGGLFHLIITILFQWFVMRDMEKLCGAIRMAFIYLGSGIAGNLASSIFLPYQVEAGPSGSQFGILACLFVEVFQSWQLYRRPFFALLKLLIPMFLLFLFGLLPWFDNWAHLFGFIFGILIAFVFVPYLSFGRGDKQRKCLGIAICLSIALAMYAVLIILLYVMPIRECAACQYFNCIPFTSDFCENMGVSIKRNSTYSSF